MIPVASANTENAVKWLLGSWIPRFGVPKALVADNGSHFKSHELKEVCDKLSIKTKPIVPFHPKSNGAVERRFRELNKAVRIFASVDRDWESILPQFLFSTRNLENSVTGFSPAELVYGQKLRTTLSIDGNFNRFADLATELNRTLYRLNMAEQVVADKKLALFQKSKQRAEDRYDIVEYEEGDEVFTYVDVTPPGVVAREFVPWEGPFRVLKVRLMNLEIDKYGARVTVNKTKCIRVRPLVIPERDLAGREIEETEEFKRRQDEMVRDKIRYLKKKIVNGEEAPIGPADPRVQVQEPEKVEKRHTRAAAKAARDPPPRRIEYKAVDIKRDDFVLVYIPDKKGMYLGRVENVWMPENDTEEWIRVLLYGRDEKEQGKFVQWRVDV